MTSKPRAFKTQKEKPYGSVEKMYVHFYTRSYTKDTLELFWYTTESENQELFSDFKDFLGTLHSYSQVETFTGDIILVKNMRQFKETLILLGADDFSTSVLSLQGDLTKDMEKSVVKKPAKFNELFELFLHNYEIISSFSSEETANKTSELNKNSSFVKPCTFVKPCSLDMNDFNKYNNDISTVTIKKYIDTNNKIMNGFKDDEDDVDEDVDDENTVKQTELNNKLILVTFESRQYVMPQYAFKQLPYTIINTKVDSSMLLNWFSKMIKDKEYQEAIATILRLIEYNKLSGEDVGQEEQEQEEQEQEQDSLSVITQKESPKISHNDWIKLFCDLYVEKQEGYDILLSDLYQDYLTASSWTETPTVTMVTFTKQIRSLNLYPIKRRSKGVVIIGYRCLVGEQANMFNDEISMAYGRKINGIKSWRDIDIIVRTYKDEIEAIGHKYAREVFILCQSPKQATFVFDTHNPLNFKVKLNYQMVAQFTSIPQLSSQFPIYAQYIDNRVKYAFESDFQKQPDEIKKIGSNCRFYFPFSSNACTFENAKTNTDISTNRPKPFTAFNEHFGMFKTSKKYHYFEEEKGIPQDYNNMMGTPIDESWTENPFPTEEDESNYLKGLLGKTEKKSTEEVWGPGGWIGRPVRMPEITVSTYIKKTP